MALKGSFSGKTSNSRIKPTITWSAVQSVEGNFSEITATLSYSRTNTGYTTGGTWQGAITIGDQTFTGSKYIEITYNSNTVAITATARVNHDSYGKKSLTISASGGIVNPGSSTLQNTSVSALVELDTIARASAVSAANADIGSRSTVVVSRKNEGFTHSIAYSFGALSGYIDADGNTVDTEVKLSATTINFLLPERFYDQIPDAPSGVCTLTCRTYSGDTQIGTEQTGEFTVTASYDRCAPVVSGTVRDVNSATVKLTGNEAVLVQYVSVARCQIAARERNGAHITGLRIGGVTVTDNVRDITSPAMDTVTFEATDSRGYTAVYEAHVPMIPYVLLTNNATVQRTDPTSGNAVLTMLGSCWNGNFGAGSNFLHYEYSVDGVPDRHDQLHPGADHTYRETEVLTGLDYTKAHTVELTVRDAVMEVKRTLTVGKGIPVFDWGEADFRFHVPVECPGLTVGGVSLADYIKSIIEGG